MGMLSVRTRFGTCTYGIYDTRTWIFNTWIFNSGVGSLMDNVKVKVCEVYIWSSECKRGTLLPLLFNRWVKFQIAHSKQKKKAVCISKTNCDRHYYQPLTLLWLDQKLLWVTYQHWCHGAVDCWFHPKRLRQSSTSFWCPL